MNRGPTGVRPAVLETTWGGIFIWAGPRGVRACELPQLPRRLPRVGFRLRRIRLPAAPSPALRRAARFARDLLAGRNPGPCPPLDAAVFAGVPSFRRAVWQALHRIPRGRTVSYAQLAQRAGAPRAARAAGSACGANPLPLFIPCHRVVASGGGLGGFSSGLDWKRLLLAAEGVRR